jgi:hypothetical protein
MGDFWGGIASGIGSFLGSIGSGLINSKTQTDVNNANIAAQERANAQNQANWEKQFSYTKEQDDWYKNFTQTQADTANANNEWSKQFQQSQVDWNQNFQTQQANYQKYLAENAYQIKANDLKAAGLNPVLAAGSGLSAGTVSAPSAMSGGLSSPTGASRPSSGGSSKTHDAARSEASRWNLDLSGFVQGALLQSQIKQSEAAVRQSDALAYYYTEQGQAVAGNLQAYKEDVGQRVAKTTSDIGYQHTLGDYYSSLTDRADYALNHMDPVSYQSAVVDNAIKQRSLTHSDQQTTLNAQQILRQDLAIVSDGLKNELTRLQSEVVKLDITRNGLENAVTQYQVDLWEQGINPSHATPSSINRFVDSILPDTGSPIRTQSRKVLQSLIEFANRLLPNFSKRL